MFFFYPYNYLYKMMQENNKLQEGLDSVNRIKLLMAYDMSKTLNENLNEQSIFGGGQGGYVIPPTPKKVKLTPEQLQFQKEHPEMVWDPNVPDDNRPMLDKSGRTVYPYKGKFVPLTPENIGLRGVPFGFSPLEYSEYLKKVREINKKYPKSETKFYDPRTWVDSDIDDKREKLLSDLKKQYYRPEFWKGITKQDYQLWKKTKSVLGTEKEKELERLSRIKSAENDITMYPEKDVLKKYYSPESSNSRTVANKNYNDAVDKYGTLEQYMNVLFEYDPSVFEEMNKTVLEKFWDKYGLIGELVFWAAVDYLTASFAMWITGARQAYIFGKVISKMGGAEKVAAIIRFMGVSGLPVAIGVEDIIRNEKVTERAVLYFIFATLPYAHKYYNISKPTKEVCESTIRKMYGYNINTPKGLSDLLKVLTEEEKSLVRKVLTMDKKSIETGIRQTIDDVNRAAQKDLVKLGQKTGTLLGKDKKIQKFLKTFLIDVTSIEIIKKIALDLGITLDDVKQKELITLLDSYKNNPEYRSFLMKETYLLLKSNPNWEVTKLINQIKQKTNISYENYNLISNIEEGKEVLDVAKKLKFNPLEGLIDPDTGEEIKN
jgi:hypothetical protein